MSHQVPWNKVIVEAFIDEAMLTKEEEAVLRTRVAGWTRTKQCDQLNLSMSTLDRIIKRLKQKYDNAARFNPLLPPRKSSAAELYMDEH